MDQIPVVCKSFAGEPYTRWITKRMPAIPYPLLDCVVYLYGDKESALAGKRYGGCGFLLSVSTQGGRFAHLYLVTNYHVAIRDGFCVARVNSQAGGVDIFEFDSSEFIFNPGGGDVCAVSLQLTDTHKWASLDISHLATRDHAERGICLGDDVFMLGRFIEHDGGVTNRPAARFGNISVEPGHIAGLPNSDDDCPYYCLDMHSRSGYSGAPVWVYRPPCANLIPVFMPKNYRATPGSEKTLYGMCAIHCAQFPEEIGPTEEGKLITGYSGMTIALPAWKIRELILENETFKAQRKTIESSDEHRGKPIPESAKDDDKTTQARFDTTIRRMLNTPPTPKTKRPKKPT